MLPFKWTTFFLPPPEPRLRYGHSSNDPCHIPVWRLAAWTSCFLPPFVFYFIFLFSFCGYIAFVRRSTAIPAVRIPVCTLYSKQTCSYRNFDVSVIYIMLIQQSTGIRSYTRYDTSAVVALYVLVKVTE